MKTLLLTSRALFIAALAAAASLHAQSNATPPALGLLRLKSETRANDAAPLAAGRFTVDDLSVAGASGEAKGRRNDADYLALEPGREWSRPLRGNPRDVTFVSFQVYGSQTTIIDLAGARLGLTAGPIAGSLQLMYDDSATGTPQWRALNLHFAAGQYSGQSFAALPTLTVRLDPAAGDWDLYAGGWLVADSLPLIGATKSDCRFSLRAGNEGAWIAGLVLSDENPIYDDANANGLDDRFELAQRGALLPANAARAERQSVAQRWRDSQRATPPPRSLSPGRFPIA